MYVFNPENVNNELQISLRQKRFLAPIGIADKMVYNDLAVVETYDKVLEKIKSRYSAENNKLINKDILAEINVNMGTAWQGRRDLLLLDWLVSAFVCLYNHAKSISPNNRTFERVKIPLYHLGEASPIIELTFGFPPSFSICGFIQSNATKQLEDLHGEYDWYDSGLFSALIAMMAQHWRLWSGNLSYPIPANYSCTMRKNLDDQIRQFIKMRGWAPEKAEQIIECRNVALIPHYSFTSKQVVYKNKRHFAKREKLDNELLITRSWLANQRYMRFSRDQNSFFDGVQGQLRLQLVQFILDNLIAFQLTHNANDKGEVTK